MKRGFTLIEFMIVLAIIGLLLAIAIPAYQKYRAGETTVKEEPVKRSAPDEARPAK